jgi:glycosyltransferase involved in cell wall biosynthesis
VGRPDPLNLRAATELPPGGAEAKSHEVELRMPTVSVIIPSFNCAEFLGDAIESVLAQTMQAFEVIVVDDGSTDGTAEVIGRYSSDLRIRYIYQDNRGLPGARNTGALSSTGRFLAFLDADDSLAADALEKLSSALLRSEASWCVMDLLKVCGAKRELRRTEIPAGDAFYGILRDDFIRRGMFFRREDFMAAGMYDEQMKNREDWDINIRMLERGKAFHYIPEPLYLYSWREGSITTGNPAKMLFYTEQILRKHHKRLADAGDPEAVKLYAENMWGLARNHFYLTRNVRKALQCVRESLAYDPSPRRLFHPVVHQLQKLTAS